ncbi:MAG: hypothetical protein NZ821_09980, partial [Gloeomargarita sp. SKYB31]|nr:hypothetical protein [Gloeomargarita sp. SKYB31]
YGNYSVQFNNLVYNASCDYPVGGNIRITAGGFVALISFAESSCGIGFASLNNQSPVEFNLEELSDLYNPCGS